MEHTCRFQSNESSGEFEARQTLHQIQLAEGLAIPQGSNCLQRRQQQHCKQKQTTRSGTGRVHQPPPLIIEDTVKTPIEELIEDAVADGGDDGVP